MFATVGLAGALLASVFMTAKPVWPEAYVDEMNVTCMFMGAFEWKAGDPEPLLRATGSSVYAVSVNGEFAFYGPARGPKGYYRVDEVPLKPFLKEGANTIGFVVAGYNVNSYYLLDQKPFLQAEVVAGGKALWATDPKATPWRRSPVRVQKVSRYSFQRPFGEAYDARKASVAAATAADIAVSRKLKEMPKVKYLPRRAPLPEFRVTEPFRPYAKGKGGPDASVRPKANRAVANVTRDGALRGFPEKELDENLFYDFQRYRSAEIAPYAEVRDTYALKAGEQLHFEGAFLDTGFIRLPLKALSASAKVAVTFDEILVNGKIDPPRSDCGNLVTVALDKADDFAAFQTFEPYAFKYLTVTVLEGEAEFAAPRLVEYVYPLDMRDQPCEGCVFGPLVDAARRTFAENAVDCFTDCPGRERAGWLCDSFWTARVSKFLTKSVEMETLFLENFALAERFDHLEDGVLPMCYPADHDDGWFIPNWAMWCVLELEEYAFDRGGDPEIVKKMRPRVLKLMDWFAKHENKDGLLEKLPSWNFIEWSKANDFTQDVNYPSNMTYARVLDAVARLYGRKGLTEKARRIRETVVKQSFNGTFFRDHAVREDGKLAVKDDVTETCQYYAFFTGAATPETHPELWARLINEFGPYRAEKGLYKEVWPSNAFVGNYLRLDLLARYGLKEQLKREISGYFNKMAAATGTLWEHDNTSASCCHGFASYVGVLIDKATH